MVYTNCDSIRMLIFNHEQVLMSALETHKIEIAIVPLRGPLRKQLSLLSYDSRDCFKGFPMLHHGSLNNQPTEQNRDSRKTITVTHTELTSCYLI